MAAGSRWNDMVLKIALHLGLNMEVLTELACHDEHITLDSLINFAICSDNLLHNCSTHLQSFSSSDTIEIPEPMHINYSMLSLTEQERRRKERLCFYWANPNHVVAKCPMQGHGSVPKGKAGRTSASANKTLVNPSRFISHQSFTLNVQIRHSEYIFILTDLTDSRAAGNFTDEEIQRLQLPTYSLQHPLWIKSTDGGPISTGVITLFTVPIHLQVRALHEEPISTLVTATT